MHTYTSPATYMLCIQKECQALKKTLFWCVTALFVRALSPSWNHMCTNVCLKSERVSVYCLNVSCRFSCVCMSWCMYIRLGTGTLWSTVAVSLAFENPRDVGIVVFRVLWFVYVHVPCPVVFVCPCACVCARIALSLLLFISG